MAHHVQSCLLTIALKVVAPAHAGNASNRLTCFSPASLQPAGAPRVLCASAKSPNESRPFRPLERLQE